MPAVESPMGTRNASARPMARPGKLTRSGSMRTRKSVTTRTMIRQEKRSHFRVRRVMSNSYQVRTKMRPVANSTRGYIGEMGRAQLRHLPRRSSQPKTGILSYGLIGLRQRGQREPGEMMETPSGMREMQTLRKLPMTMPKRKKKKGITVSTVPQAERRLNAVCGGACRMANGKQDGVRGNAVGKNRKIHRRDAEGRRGPRRVAGKSFGFGRSARFAKLTVWR